MEKVNKVLESLVRLLSMAPGREKFCRLVQYFCTFLTSHYKEVYNLEIWKRNELLGALLKTEKLGGAMGMTRKILRFGPSINCVRTFILNTNMLIKKEQKEPTDVLICKTLSSLFLAGYFIADHYLWLFRVGITTNLKIKEKCDYIASLSWLLDCLAGLFKNVCIYNNFSSRQKQEKLKDLAIDTCRTLLDMPVAIYFLYPGTVNGKLAGILGTCTSLIGIYQMWT